MITSKTYGKQSWKRTYFQYLNTRLLIGQGGHVGSTSEIYWSLMNRVLIVTLLFLLSLYPDPYNG